VILVDTSIWIDLLRNGRADAAAERVANHVTCGPVLQEVLQGLPDDAISQHFRDAFLVMPRLDDPLPVHVFLEAAEIYQAGRRKGYTVRSTIDCLIAAIAIRNAVPVWHKDHDFNVISRFTPLRVVTLIR
jgi:predicted nucleic acid-binding protein